MLVWGSQGNPILPWQLPLPNSAFGPETMAIQAVDFPSEAKNSWDNTKICLEKN
jgi:hypothetical protein